MNLGGFRDEAFVVTILPSRDLIFETEVNTDEAKPKIENLGDSEYLRPVNQGVLLYCLGMLTNTFVLFKPILTICPHTYNQGFSSPAPFHIV